MALLMEHQFRQLPADKQVETRPFLEAVSHLPPFFGRFFRHLSFELRFEHELCAVMKRPDELGFKTIFRTILDLKVFNFLCNLFRSSKSYFKVPILICYAKKKAITKMANVCFHIHPFLSHRFRVETKYQLNACILPYSVFTE